MAIIELVEGRHYYGFWWVAWDDTDWLLCAWRVDGADEVEAVYRFRYYRDDKVWDSEDNKTVFHMTIPVGGLDPQEAYRMVEDKFTKTAQLLAWASNAHEAEYVRIDGDHEAAARGLIQSSWANVKRMSND